MLSIDKNNPTEEWIASLNADYPCETEVERVLNRKLRLRSGPPFQPVTLESLVSGVKALLETQLDEPFSVKAAKWMTGGASKLQMYFELDWSEPGHGRSTTPLVLRMEPAASILETSRAREFQVIKALEGTVPVPPVYWYDDKGNYLPYPAIIYGFAEGVTKPSDSSSNASGVGISFPETTRAALARQFVENMVAMHRLDYSHADMSTFDLPEPGAPSTRVAENQVNWWARVWEEDIHQDVPLVQLAIAWLRQNLPQLDHISLVHGDYRTGNFLYDESTDQITAFLDWETAHFGDRHEDLSYMTNAPYPQRMPDGQILLGGLMTEEEMYRVYEEISGLPVNRDSIRFYKLLNALKVVTVGLASGYRAASLGKTHQDVVLTHVMGFAPVVLDDMQHMMEELMS
jgi:aminoglycoside phosphotransferase (APT) family kinase protein